MGDDLPDGSGAAVCCAVTRADLSIPCLLLTGEVDEAVLIESILAGVWGCLSKQDDSSEPLGLTRRVLAGYSAYSRRFLPPPDRASSPVCGLERPEDEFLSLSGREMSVAIGVGSGLSDRQISIELDLAETTVKNLVSSVLRNSASSARHKPGSLTTPLCVSSKAASTAFTARLGSPTLTRNGIHAGEAVTLADVLTAGRTGPRPVRPSAGSTPASGMT